jgi:competence protein ComEC
MSNSQPILKIFLPFILGLVFALSFVNIYDKPVSPLLIYLIVFVLILVISSSILLSILKLNRSVLHVCAWILVGTTLGINANFTQDFKHFSYIESEIYEARIDQINISELKKSKFVRCEMSTLAVYDAFERHEVQGKILAFIDTAAFGDFKLEDVVVFNAIPLPIKNQGNPGEFDLQLFWRTKGFTHQVFLDVDDIQFKSAGKYRAGVFDKMKSSIVKTLNLHLKGDVFAVAMGILLGDKSYLNLELKDAFSGAGAMHLLAVSGLHVGIFLVILQWLFKTFGRRAPRWLQFGIILLILWAYAGITGFSPSVNRAVTMFSFVALGTLTGRRYDSINGLIASAMILLVINPYFLFDIGFQLSYGAMFGIFLFSPIIERSLFIKQKWLKFIWSGTAVALAAQLTTFPLTLYYFHQFPNYFLVTNLGLMLISMVMMGIGLGLVTLGNIPVLGGIIGLLFVVTISTLIGFVEWVSQLPNAITTGFRITLWEVGLLYLTMSVFLIGLKISRKTWIYVSLATLVFFIGFQSFQSIQDTKSNEIIVLNANDPSFFIRRGKQGDLLVISNKENIEEKTQFMKRALDVYYGIDTKLHFIERKKGSISTSIPNLNIILKPAVIHIQLKDKIYTLIYGDYFKDQDLMAAEMFIGGPWVNEDIFSSIVEKNQIWMLKDRGAYTIKSVE